jgi:hypothetical protein
VRNPKRWLGSFNTKKHNTKNLLYTTSNCFVFCFVFLLLHWPLFAHSLAHSIVTPAVPFHHSISTPGVIARVSELFNGHRHLIAGFNNFLPPDHKINVDYAIAPEPKIVPISEIPQPPPPQPPPPIATTAPGERTQEELVHAREYVNKIKVFTHSLTHARPHTQYNA